MSTSAVGLSGARMLLPHEFRTSYMGVHTKWTVRVDEQRVASRVDWRNAAPDPWSWWQAVQEYGRRLPLLVRFSRDLERENGIVFYALVVLNVVQSCIPAAELYFARSLIEIAHVVGSGGVLQPQLFAFAFTGRCAIALISLAVDRLTSHLEDSINARFSLNIQTEILRIHCLLDDEQLERPDTRKKLQLLRELGGSTIYRRIFDPLGFMSVANSALSVALGGAMLWSQTTPETWVYLAISLGFLCLDEVDAWFNAHKPIEHFDVSNDHYLRFQSLFKLGTSRSLRREVTTLGIQDYIFTSALTARQSLGSTSCTSPHASQHHPPLHFLSLASHLSRPLTTSLFILHTSRLSSLSPIVSFAEMAVLEAAAWNLRVRWTSLRRGVRDLWNGVESIEALYAYENVGQREEKKGVEYVRRTRADEEGRECRGMEIEFRNVTMRYDGSNAPALDNVSFKVLPGELVSIVGHNGSGKTTLVSLLSMNHRVTSGQILVNGNNILDYSQRDLALVMSFTYQTSPVLPMSIKEYVSLGSVPHHNDEALITRALAASSANVVVDQLADGWLSYSGGMMGATLSTDDWSLPQLVPRPLGPPTVEMLGDGSSLGASLIESSEGTLVDDASDSGKRVAQVKTSPYPIMIGGEEATINFPCHSPEPSVLSGGQWQRIALARSLMKPDNDLLVWDEPASSLDPQAEAALFDQIVALRGQSTVLFTTHRFSACSRADKILMFSGGRLIEQGSHRKLMEVDGGAYRELWEVQAKGFQR